MPEAVVSSNDSNHTDELILIVKWAVLKPKLDLVLSCCATGV